MLDKAHSGSNFPPVCCEAAMQNLICKLLYVIGLLVMGLLFPMTKTARFVYCESSLFIVNQLIFFSAVYEGQVFQ